jgi:hypothetical protein
MQIQGAEGMSPENIRDEIDRGGRLVIYTYCVSILVLTFKRPTEIRLVKAGQSPAVASWPYVFSTLLFGWWGIPWGPIYTIECLYRNLSGGLDVTNEVLAQLAPTTTPPAGRPAIEAPPPTAPRRFQWKTAGLMAGGACLLGLLGITLYCYQQQQSLTIVMASGLDRPYSIVLNGRTHTLKPYAAEVLEMPEGDFVLADAPGGNVVGGEQRFTLSLPFFDHLHSEHVAVINPDRVAILINGEVPYYSDGIAPPDDEIPVFNLLTNQLAHFIPKPDFVIAEADARISMPSGTRRLVKTRLSHLKDPDIEALARNLVEKSGYSVAREHLKQLARYRTDEDLLRAAAQTLEPDDLGAFYKLHLSDRPVLVEWHRYYQQYMENRHPDHSLTAEYRAYVQAEPSNGALLYLLGRQVVDPVEQTRLWHAALAAPEPCAYAHGAMGFDALSDGKFAEARTYYDASLSAGVTSTGISHYRRHAYFALGRTADLLPEIAEARRQAPFDLQLAEEEIRLAYTANQDMAEAIRMKAAYLAALKNTRPHESELENADTYLQSVIAYLAGDIPAYARLVSRFESPFYRFRAAISTGRIDEATKVTQSNDVNSELLLYLLAQRNGDNAAAEQHFKIAHEAMRKADRELRRVASTIDSGRPDVQQICGLRMNIESKRILLTALGIRYPDDRAAYFESARKINFNPDFPRHFLQEFLAGQSSRPGDSI